MMTTDKKLAFVHKMTKEALSSIPHFDSGGGVGSSVPSNSAAESGATGPVGWIAGSAGSSPGQNSFNGNSGVNNSSSNPNNGFLGSINNSLGLNNQFVGQGANLTPGTNGSQLGTAYAGAQSGLGQQQGLVNQFSPGVAQGLGAQGALSTQLSNEANGIGPNPAQAALNQSTGQNIQQQAALQASQRGAGANAGLIAGQAAQQGAATQQQAVGQAATLQAQQQIAAQQQQQALAAQQIGQGATAVQNLNQQGQNEQNILQGANTSLNNTVAGEQENINNVNSQTAGANQNMAANTFGGLLSGGSSGISAISSMFAEGGEVGDDTPAFQPTPSDVSAGPGSGGSAPLPADTADFSKDFGSSSSGGGSSGGGGGAGIGALAALLAKGGYVQNPMMMAGGGYLAPMPLVVNNQNAPISSVGQWLNSNVSAPTTGAVPATSALPADSANIASNVPKASSKPKETQMEARGGKVMKKTLPPMHGKNIALIAKGGKVKADGKDQKAVVDHDSLSNDKVPALLSQGEVVIDKNTLHDSGPIGQMARTVANHINQRNSMSKGKK